MAKSEKNLPSTRQRLKPDKISVWWHVHDF